MVSDELAAKLCINEPRPRAVLAVDKLDGVEPS